MKRMPTALFALPLLLLLAACGDAGKEAPKETSPQKPPAAAAPTKPALTVSTVTPQMLDWAQTLKAGGNVAAWQEAVIGPEISNYRITEVRANVGDVVKKGQVLARIAADTVEAEFAEMRAAVAEAEAALAEARANHERAKQLTARGFYSAEQSTRTQTAADTAQARLEAARARLQSAGLRRAKAVVLAPDDGIVSARNATVGSLTQPGQELFRLIRGGRLEWRAEVTAAEVNRLQPGQAATLAGPDGQAVEGRVRAVAPTVDPQTRLALVYVDLPADAAGRLSAGMYVRGEFRLGRSPALTLPQSAVLLREGFAYVFRLDGEKVRQLKVATGRRDGERIEIVGSGGIDAKTVVVANGVGFLADGDTVRVVATPAAPPVPVAEAAAPDRKP